MMNFREAEKFENLIGSVRIKTERTTDSFVLSFRLSAYTNSSPPQTGLNFINFGIREFFKKTFTILSNF